MCISCVTVLGVRLPRYSGLTERENAAQCARKVQTWVGDLSRGQPASGGGDPGSLAA